jgi:hypothetical protein
MATAICAKGADKLSPVPMIPASQSAAYQRGGASGEPLDDRPVLGGGLGASLVDRRWTMNMLVTAVGTAVVRRSLELPAGTAIGSDVDPALVLIEEHKRSIAAVDRLLDVLEELGQEIPASARRSEWDVSGLTIIPSDDERWKKAQRQHRYEFYHSDEIAMRMLSVRPTTLEGAVALLEYATHHLDQGYLWPDDLSSVDEKRGDGQEHERTWLYFLNRNLAASIERLVT